MIETLNSVLLEKGLPIDIINNITRYISSPVSNLLKIIIPFYTRSLTKTPIQTRFLRDISQEPFYCSRKIRHDYNIIYNEYDKEFCKYKILNDKDLTIDERLFYNEWLVSPVPTDKDLDQQEIWYTQHQMKYVLDS